MVAGKSNSSRRPKESETVKVPSWLRRSGKDKPTETKAENLKSVRRRTDQLIKQQDARKEQAEQAEEQKKSS
jgi:hypothetical protein